MAKLNPDQAKELITAPKNKALIVQAKKHEERLLFHCEPILNIQGLPGAYNDFIAWVASFMNDAKKMERFRALLTTPVPTVTDCKSIFDELSKVFETDDKKVEFEFVSSEIEADAREYLAKIGDEQFWPIEGFNAMRIGINSILVVDLPAVQLTARPEPYYYLVSIHNVIDIEFSPKGVVEYVIFKRRDGRIVAIDDQSYRVFVKTDEMGEYQLESESVHSTYDLFNQRVGGLGYVPATSFWDAPIANTKHIEKKGPISSSLSNLDWLLFWKVSKKYLDLYGAWPIIVSYKRSCNYRDEHGNMCNEGFVNYEDVGPIVDGYPQMIPRQKLCPSCGESRGFIGPGSRWTVDPPQDKEDVDLMENPIKIVEISNDKLEYGRSEQQRLENEVYMDSVGWDGDAMNKQAVNESQVSANFVSKESILDGIQVQIERTRKFALETVFIYRYGDYFLRAGVFQGRNYFLKTPDELTTEYKNAMLAGLPMYMISNMREQISRTQNRNNPEQAERDFILSNLEPYPDFTLAQLVSMQVPYTDPIGYQIKLNFNTFIQRFEREQMNIIEFASLRSFKDKISIIQTKLNEYAKEKNPIPQPDQRGAQGVTV